jgi:hypothetical protein
MSDGVQDGMRRYDLEIPQAGLGAFKMFGTLFAGTKRFLYTIKYICANPRSIDPQETPNKGALF